MLKRYLKPKYFYKINALTLGSVLLLILVGSIVRVSGSGMGCPDWPKCFGQYAPPTSAEQLPADYQDTYRDKRLKKNERLANLFIRFGYNQLARKVTSDPSVLVEQEFSVSKAWIEYINRLVGVLIGLFVLLNMVFSFSMLSKSVFIPVFGVVIFVLTGFQGWVGSLVVSTNLLHGFITFHMLLAIVIVALLIWMRVKAKGYSSIANKQLFLTAVFTTLIFIPQIVMGTEVRGVVDELYGSAITRANWIDQLGNVFLVHRSYSWLILAGSAFIWFKGRKEGATWLRKASAVLLTMVLLIMLFGVGMAHLDFPAVLQPLHLILAVGIFSMLFYLTLRLKYR